MNFLEQLTATEESIRRNAFAEEMRGPTGVLSLHLAYCSFYRIYTAIRGLSGDESGIADHVWSLAELLTGPPSHQVPSHTS